jgi:cytochrome c oxidase subunit 2
VAYFSLSVRRDADVALGGMADIAAQGTPVEEGVKMDLFAPIALVADCVPTHDLSIFRPASPAGGAIVQLSLLVLAVAAGIYLIVTGVLFYCVVRFRRRGAQLKEPPQVYGSVPIEVAWTAAPTLIVFFLVLVTTRTLWEVEVDPPEPTAGDNTLFVTVVGRQWWWEYRYDHYDGRPLGFVTANELHIPQSNGDTPRRTYLTLRSADVCHSFWVPRLGGKTDLIPGRVNDMWLETEHAGLFLGQCAEYCGTQHAGMLLRVVVDDPEQFNAWLAREGEPVHNSPAENEAATIARGRGAFHALSCVNCHAIRGTTAAGTFGPDLTHLMNRETLAAGMVPNTRENLRRWIADPQHIKPGCLMPAFGLDEQQLDDVVAYLESLR